MLFPFTPGPQSPGVTIPQVPMPPVGTVPTPPAPAPTPAPTPTAPGFDTAAANALFDQLQSNINNIDFREGMNYGWSPERQREVQAGRRQQAVSDFAASLPEGFWLDQSQMGNALTDPATSFRMGLFNQHGNVMRDILFPGFLIQEQHQDNPPMVPGPAPGPPRPPQGPYSAPRDVSPEDLPRIPPVDPRVPGIPLGDDFGTPQFDDAGAALLEDLIRIRLGELTQDAENPGLQQLISTLQGQFDTGNASLEQLLGGIGGRIDALEAGPADLLASIDQRIAELRGPAFTRGEEELIRTQALDRISATQDADMERMLEAFGAMGRAPTSGVNAELMRQMASDFAAQRTQAESDFAHTAAATRNQRLDQALGLEQSAEANLQQRLNQALGLRGQLNTLDSARRNEQVNLATQLSAIEDQVRAQADARRREALSMAGLLSELPERRLQLALATLGMQPPPQPLFPALSNFANIQQNQQALALQAQALQHQANQFNQQNIASLMQGLGSMFPTQQPQPQPFLGGATPHGTSARYPYGVPS